MTDIASLRIAINTGDLKKARAELDKLEKSGKKTETTFKKLPALISAVVASMAVREVVRYADSMTLVNSKLKLVTSSSSELISVQKKLFDISQNSRVGYEDTVDLYSRMARSTKELNLSNEDLLTVTDNISKSLIISGGSAESMNAALVQLGQGFASGQLRGQELNSVLEQTPRLARMISDGMGIAYGDLRKYAEQGKITSEALVNAIISQTSAMDKEFGSMNLTVGQSIVKIDNSFMNFIGTLNDATGATEGLANMFSGLSGLLDDTADKIKSIDEANSKRKKITLIKDLEEASLQLDIIQSNIEKAKQYGDSIFTGSVKSLTKDYKEQQETLKKLSYEYSNLFDEIKNNDVTSSYKKVSEMTQAEIDAKIKGQKEVNAHVEAYYARLDELEKMHQAITQAGIDFAKEESDRKYNAMSIELSILKEQSELISDNGERGIALANANYEIAKLEFDKMLENGQLTKQQYADKMYLQEIYRNKVINDYTYMGQAVQALGDSMEESFSSFFDYLNKDALDFGALMKNILHDVYMDLMRNLVIKQMVSGITSAFSPSSDVSSLPSLDTPTGGSTLFAKGGVHNSPSLSAHSNTIVSKTTPFYFASGGVPNLGIMGEAGSEAIMPLTRTQDGDLGVKVTGSSVNVTVINNAGAEVSTSSNDNGDLTIVLDAVANSIRRGTGTIGSSIESAYGLNRR